MKSKRKHLEEILKGCGKVAVALSGGLDSSTLVAFASKVLGAQNCMALTVHAPYMMQDELAGAKALCAKYGVRQDVFPIDNIPDAVTQNPPNRCFVCKTFVFEKLVKRVKELGFDTLADGTNADDLSDYRPGLKALKDLGIKSPLLEAQMGKADIRRLARASGLSKEFASKPAYACLMTRFEHGTKITPELLKRTDEAESFLRKSGFKKVRVRLHGDLARIELDPKDIKKAATTPLREEINAKLKALGYKNVSLDLAGYKMGAMNIHV